eukprot:COSAG02_NODE_4674_length_5106_cov_9.921310_4_plen_66_part_00
MLTPVILSHVNTPRHPSRTQIERFAKQLNVSPNTQPEVESVFSSVTEHQKFRVTPPSIDFLTLGR